jgi:ribosomal protein S18 acetylase RimI-like enzyme
MSNRRYLIAPARSPDDIFAATQLLDAYVEGLGIDLTFQDFASERAAMPGKYAPPRGELLLARAQDGTALGCVGLRPIQPEAYCEIKRLYVAPKGRGLGLGRALAEAILDVATRLGYRDVRLDTLPAMIEAISLYRTLGFRAAEAYYETPIPDTIFMGRKLP